jgi:hypothetical protein
MPLIRGFAYPLTLENGGLKTSTDLDLIRESIYSVLETRPFERVMRSRYGTADLVFDAYASAGVIAERVRQSLELQIREASFEVLGTLLDSGEASLEIRWSVATLPQPAIRYKLFL